MAQPEDALALPADEAGEEQADELTLPASGSHFKAAHREEVLAVLTRIRDGGADAHARGELDYKRVRDVLEEYQEQGVLLRSVLPEFAALIVDAFWRAARADCDEVLQPFGDRPVEELLRNTAPFEEDDAPRTHLHELGVLAYTLAKVVGPKNLVSHLPHDVRQFEYAFYYLIWSIRTHAERTWEVRYLLMLWLTNTVLVPFDLSSIDSSMHATVPLTRLLVEVAQHCLRSPGKVREVGALFVSRLLTRPDLARSEHIAEFLKWCARTLAPVPADVPEASDAAFGKVGALAAISGVLKHGKRVELAPYLDFISDVLTQEHLTQLNNMLISKTLVKGVQRLGLAYLRPRVVAWRYQRGMRSLLDNLHSAGSSSGAGAAAAPAAAAQEEAAVEDVYAPLELEPILAVLLESLKNQDTIVRWSAAKGVGRVTARLEKPEADDVVNAVLETFDLYEDSNGWHGGCLALAELARRGLLLPRLFDRVVPVTLKALQYEVVKGSYTVGRHVRDAGCYVCWAFARAYSPADLQTYTSQMSSALLSTACFDKEISVRRAAAAAFQECVGRLGSFPHGIDIVTRADYFSLSVRRRAFLDVAPVVASYDAQYHSHFASHLVENRLLHCDRDVRTLASKTLGRLAAAETGDGEIVTTHVAELLTRSLKTGSADARHGAILGVAEVVGAAADKLSAAVLAEVWNLMPAIESARLYRGRGGEHIRVAVCRLIEELSEAGVPLPDVIEVTTVKGKTRASARGRYQQCIDENLSQVVEAVQVSAAAAFAAFSKQYFTSFEEKFHGKVTRRLVGLLAETCLPNERRGAALALGLMPHFAETHGDVLAALLRCIPVEEEPSARDAETRRNACTAAAEVTARAGCGCEAVEAAFSALEAATTDYTIDQRGDVGSLVRVAAMEGLARVAVAMAGWAALTRTHAERLLQALLRQATEKLDKVRSCAGGILARLGRDEAVAALLGDEDRALVGAAAAAPVADWGAPLDTYTTLAPLLASAALRDAVLDGCVVAAGGMSVHVSRPAFDALAAYLRGHEEDAEVLGLGVARILRANSRDERVVLPLLGTADKLISLSLLSAAAAPVVAAAVREEVKKAVKEIHTLLPAVDVLCGLLTLVEGSDATLLLHCLLSLLAGRFPKVRRKAATSLYTTLVLCPHIGTDNAEAQLCLASEQWDAPSAEAVRAARDRLYPMLGLTKPVFAKSGPASGAATQARKQPLPDANANYSALVRDAGY